MSFSVISISCVLICVWRTKLIDDSKLANPRYKGLVHGTLTIAREEGIRGIYSGLFPVVCPPVPETRIVLKFTFKMMRQAANSAVRFTTYTTVKQFVQGNARPGQTLPTAVTFGVGAVAGLVTVYTTMPLECATHPHMSLLTINTSVQCYQNQNAIIKRAFAIFKFLPLRISNLQGRGDTSVLDWNDS